MEDRIRTLINQSISDSESEEYAYKNLKNVLTANKRKPFKSEIK